MRIAAQRALGARASVAMPAAGAMPGWLRGRLFRCAHCQAEVLVCIGCDRGRRYCGSECSAQARRQSLRTNGKNYQSTRTGRMAHARRAQRYRLRKREQLAQLSPPPPPPSSSPSPPPLPPPRDGDASVGSQGACAGGVLAAELGGLQATGDEPLRPCHWCARGCHSVVRRDFPRRIRAVRLIAPDRRRGAAHGQSP